MLSYAMLVRRHISRSEKKNALAQKVNTLLVESWAVFVYAYWNKTRPLFLRVALHTTVACIHEPRHCRLWFWLWFGRLTIIAHICFCVSSAPMTFVCRSILFSRLTQYHARIHCVKLKNSSTNRCSPVMNLWIRIE